MTIDLKWTLPFVMPFGFFLIMRALWLISGAAWSHPDDMAILCFLVGTISGFVSLGAMGIEEIKWNVTIGKKRK